MSSIIDPVNSTLVCNRIENSLWLEWIADAVSVPAHWYYQVGEMKRAYGAIESYLPVDPSHPHPDSWVYFQHINPEEEQRGWPFRIFHNNADLFQKPGTHYHHGMKAGESTLHARVQEILMQSVIRSVLQQPSVLYDHPDYCKRFFSFMTTPGTHPDTYIGGAMRYFFKQYAVDPSSFEGKGYNDPCVSGITLVLPLLHLVSAAGGSVQGALALEKRLQIVHKHLFLTHASDLLYEMVLQLLELVAALIWRPAEAPGEPKCDAERLLSTALQRMMDTNMEKAKDAEVVCGLPGVQMETATADKGSIAAPDSTSKTNHAAADPSSSSKDPAYNEWKASLQSASGRIHTLEQLMSMSNQDAFDAVFSVRCYAERALPGALYLTLKACHAASKSSSTMESSISGSVKTIVTEAILSNAQLAGDNSHRGMILGMLLGLVFGDEADRSSLISGDFQTQLRKHSNQNADLASLFHSFSETIAQMPFKEDHNVKVATLSSPSISMPSSTASSTVAETKLQD